MGFPYISKRRPKKRSLPEIECVFGQNEDGDHQLKHLYHKLVELWVHIIKWCPSKRCHPKMVTPGAGCPPPPPPPSDTTDLKLNILKLADIYGFELAKYMHQLHNNRLLFYLHEDYVKLNEMHSQGCRNPMGGEKGDISPQ